MKELYYTFQTLIRGKSSNVIKVASLTLGLFVGVLLFACVAFQLCFYNFLRQPEQLYLTYLSNVLNGVEEEAFPYTYGTFSTAMRENFPKEVEDATILRDVDDCVFYHGDVRLKEPTIYSDEHLFSTLGLKVLAGKPEDLLTPDAVFISETLAKKIRAGEKTESVIGKVLYADRKEPLTVRGVYEDMGENTDFAFNVVKSMTKLWNDKRGGWGYDISYQSIIRFRNDADIKKVEARIPEMLKKYIPDFNKEVNDSWKLSFRPLQQLHTSNTTVKTMILVMTVLAVSILLIAAFNYVLISVSSLARRAKAVGVHKCNGATDGCIFRMFLMETALIVLLSVVIVVGLMFQFRGFVEEITAARLDSLFTVQTLWAPSLVVLAVFILAGVIPAGLFSSVPVTQVFRRYTEQKTYWKRPLLFVQFMGMTFIIGFLVVVLYQYHAVMNKDIGYNPDRVVVSWFDLGNERENAKNYFMNLPMVEDYGAGAQQICYGLSGDTFDVGDNRKVNARIEWADVDFVPMIGIKILQGKNFGLKDEVLVNEEFVRQAHWTGNPVGKQINYYGDKILTVVGVLKDFSVYSAYESQAPIMLICSSRGSCHYLRLKEPFEENLNKLNAITKAAFPTNDVVFQSLRKNLDAQYVDVVRFRDAVWLASISILLIALMGLLGYVNDEIRRRSKEIAIRKVNGAEAVEILTLLSKDILWTALPAVVIGGIGAWIIGGKWMEQFSDSSFPENWMFVIVALWVLLLIITCVVIKAWHVANENPVKSIKAE